MAIVFYGRFCYNERAKTAKCEKIAETVFEMAVNNVEELNLEAYFGKNTFTRQELLQYAVRENSEFRETRLRYLLGSLMESEQIARVARNRYVLTGVSNHKHEYLNLYSDASCRIIEIMLGKYPLLDFRIWELRWLNEFFNHQAARNIIFLETEKEGCEYIFSALKEGGVSGVMLKPTVQDMFLYGQDNTIVIDKLIGEAPRGKPCRYNVPLEKLIVDLFANKLLRSMISQGDYAAAITDMFAKYRVDQSKLFRYARRRGKEEIIRSFILGKTEIKLL